LRELWPSWPQLARAVTVMATTRTSCDH
jgi:hypothetical protein